MSGWRICTKFDAASLPDAARVKVWKQFEHSWPGFVKRDLLHTVDFLTETLFLASLYSRLKYLSNYWMDFLIFDLIPLRFCHDGQLTLMILPLFFQFFNFISKICWMMFIVPRGWILISWFLYYLYLYSWSNTGKANNTPNICTVAN